MEFRQSVAAASVSLLSVTASATVITHGSLTSDDTTNYITDTATSRQYTRFDAFNLSYADTLAAIGPAGLWEGWSVADSRISDDFVNALFQVTTPCSGAANHGTSCGSVIDWSDGDFGAAYSTSWDYFAYLSSYDTPNIAENPIGMIEIYKDGEVRDHDDWLSIERLDFYGGYALNLPINLLLYRNSRNDIPTPSTLVLMSLGFAGIGFQRRRMISDE